MSPAWPEEMGGCSQREVSSVPHPCWDLSHAGHYHTGCLTMEVSRAVLRSAQHLENSREEEGSCKETSSLPLRAPMDTYPRWMCRGLPEGNPWELRVSWGRTR